jgi:hypothetical protein
MPRGKLRDTDAYPDTAPQTTQTQGEQQEQRMDRFGSPGRDPEAAACRSRIMNSWINLTALWKVVVFGLLAGAGLPALFAVGLYSLTRGPKAQAAGADPDSESIVGGSVAGLIAAALCFLVILAAIG